MKGRSAADVAENAGHSDTAALLMCVATSQRNQSGCQQSLQARILLDHGCRDHDCWDLDHGLIPSISLKPCIMLNALHAFNISLMKYVHMKHKAEGSPDLQIST